VTVRNEMGSGGGERAEPSVASAAAVASVGRLFVVGAPRSGTSWVQRLAAEQPGVATVPELHLFSRYLRPLMAAWRSEVARLDPVITALGAGEAPHRRLIGLPTCLSEERFEAVARGFLDEVTREVLLVHPDVRLLIEKTPSNSLLVPLIHELYPDAGYVHVIRDPRDVVRSLRSAASGWAREWAPRSALFGALTWRVHVTGSRQAEALRPSDYLEVRYEDLRSDDPVSLRRLRDFLSQRAGSGPPGGSSGDARLVVSGEVRGRLAGHPVREPAEFGTGRETRAALTRTQKVIVETVCGDLMDPLGYRRSRLSRALGPPVVGTLRAVTHRLPPARLESLRQSLQHRSLRSLL
jgi:hypothetical protein